MCMFFSPTIYMITSAVMLWHHCFGFHGLGKQVSEVSNGYAASELTVPGADMTKSDIYSYGVVLLELLTRRRAFDRSVIALW